MARPLSANPRSTHVTVRLTDAEAADLDALRAKMGLNRSDLTRYAIKRLVAARKKKDSTS